MALRGDLRVLWNLAFRRGRGETHAERMASFYSGQASDYDAFRERLLHSRDALYAKLPTPAGGVWLELGGGTAATLERLGDRLAALASVTVVDLAPALLAGAAARAKARGWSNVVTVEADVAAFRPARPADVIAFSYSLTMIPDWFAAIDQAISMLKPGGVLGVADFHVSRKHPEQGLARHGWTTRHGWPAWFATDNVHPSPDHLPYLRRRLDTVHLSEGRGKVPYLPFVRAPYYVFIGRKPL